MPQNILMTQYCERCGPQLGKKYELPTDGVVPGHKVGRTMRCEYCRDPCHGRVLTDEEAMRWDTDIHAWFWLKRHFPDELERRKDWVWTKDGGAAERG